MNAWFSKGLIAWYSVNKRDLPWRQVQDPYLIWLSEIILQQTQVVQGLSYYNRFVQRFPNVKKLASASEDEVLKLWQGLGYYSRARNLHAAAKSLVNEHKGQFPQDIHAIKKLKGVGDYTSAAIASFAFDLPHAVVDGNVYRVLSRVFGIDTAIDSAEGKKRFQDLADALLDKKDPATHNQAIMEFGSQYCKPTNPDCESCIFKKRCIAYEQGLVGDLPFKEKKIKVRDRYFNYLVIADHKKKILVKRRGPADIWHGLYEFILIESKQEWTMKQLKQHINEYIPEKTEIDLLHQSKAYKHQLTHQRLHARFFVLRANLNAILGFQKIGLDKLSTLAFPRLIDKFLSDCELKEIL